MLSFYWIQEIKQSNDQLSPPTPPSSNRRETEESKLVIFKMEKKKKSKTYFIVNVELNTAFGW